QTAQLALRWTALDPGPLLDFIFELARARNWSEFRAAAADFSGAAVSACYADADGHIGYQLVGRLPARSGDGQMPVPGWTGDYDWTGVLPADANPSIADPPSGVVINANDRPTQDPHVVGYMGEWDPGFRATYIAQRLAGTGKADLGAMRSLQTDFTSLPVSRFREAVLAPWFGEVGDPAVRGRDAIAGVALDDAAKDLASRFGADPKSWRWGDVHTITFAHPLAVGPLALLLNIGPLKRPGDGYSVNNEAY